MNDWKEVTSYSRGGSRAPTAWSLAIPGGFRLVVTLHRDYPGRWVAHLHSCWESRDIGPSTWTAQQAQSAALESAADTFERALEAVRSAQVRP